jgi:putative ABC transport system substrate-binding protein
MLRGLAVCALLVFAGPLLAAPDAEAQAAGRRVKIGVLSSDAPGSAVSVLVDTLRELGWVEGRNADIVLRSGRGDPAALAALAQELAEMKVDVIVSYGTEGALAARQATTTIPIVMAISGDPVRAGLVTSLARPGGNVTGNAVVTRELSVRRLEMLRDVVPRARRIGILGNPDNTLLTAARPEDERAAERLGLELVSIDVTGAPKELDGLPERLGRAKVDALLVYADPVVLAARKRLLDIVSRRRLPTVVDGRDMVEAGALMSYAPSAAALTRRTATTIDRVLRGVSPADLPIQQPVTFELVVNRRTARTLGVTVPSSILLRADVVE